MYIVQSSIFERTKNSSLQFQESSQTEQRELYSSKYLTRIFDYELLLSSINQRIKSQQSFVRLAKRLNIEAI